MDKIILIGAGGHSKVIKDIILATPNFELYGVVDDAINETHIINGVTFSNTSLLREIDVYKYMFLIAIGNNDTRKRLVNSLSIPEQRFATVIHPSATISKTANIGRGTVIMPQVVINADTIIGEHCIINTGSIIEHDNKIGNYVHVSPSATLTGSVSVGEGAHIGAGSTVIPSKAIGKWTTIGAGAVVINDINSKTIAVGVPAREINSIEKR
ncbi:acetyltransferase [Virgibacillus sp. MG-45]|uniref:acetyltransferase n=1 Tax=Virgibacillus sp. MG-45 TaxID=3102791 RepID=UPI002ED8F776